MKRKQILWVVISLLAILVLILGYYIYIKQKPTPVPVQTPQVQTQSTTQNTDQKTALQNSEYAKLIPAEKEQYDKIKKAIEDKEPYFIEFSEQKLCDGQIKYDFNNDGKIETLAYSTTRSADNSIVGKVKISIGDSSLEQKYADDGVEVGVGIEAIGVVDTDIKDNYVDFYLREGQMSDRQENTIYRLTDEGIKKIDDFMGEILALSGDGKIYYWGGNLFENYNYDYKKDEVIKPKFNIDLVINYYDINKKDYVDTNQIVGKTITSDRTIRVYRNEDDVPNGAPITEDQIEREAKGKLVKTIEIGEQFKVIETTGRGGSVKIQANDGKQGWIGGFHMVWD